MHQPPIDVKSIRESKGLTLKDISDLTRISIIHLESIENETFDLLPPPVYSKSFIKKYAEAIGIAGDILLKRYEDFLETTQKTYPEQRPHRTSAESGKKIYLIIGILAVLILGVLFVFYASFSNRNAGEKTPAVDSPIAGASNVAKLKENQFSPTTDITSDINSTQTDKSNARIENQPVKASPRPHEKDVNQPAKGVSKPLITNNENQPAQEKTLQSSDLNKENSDASEVAKPYILTVEAKELTWIRIAGDEEDEPYDALLRPGDKIKRSSTKGFLIDCGNAGGIDIAFQGKSLGRLGEQGEVVHLRLP